MDNEFYKEVLSDLEKEKLITFNTDEVMKEAVKKILLAGVYYNGTLKAGQKPNPRRNWVLSLHDKNNLLTSNEAIGQEFKGYSWAINAIESAYEEFSKFKKEKAKGEKPINPAI